MQCIWSTLAKSVTWRNSYRTAGLSCSPVGRTSAGVRSNVRQKYLWTTAVPRCNASPAVSHFPPPPSSPRSDQTPELFSRHFSEHLSGPQLSRAAAQAVRMCTPREALYIVNSLHYSTFPGSQLSAARLPECDERPTLETPRLPKHIKFERPVSPRLASHSFLHMLIRQGLVGQAAKYAEMMMQQNIRVHRRTTETIVQTLCAHQNSLLPSQLLNKIKNQVQFTPKVNDVPPNIKHSALVAAQSILSCAREFGQERTERMYENLIKSWIMQGEIIVASLLFVLLVKDWQLYKARKDAMSQEQPMETTLDVQLDHSQPRLRSNIRSRVDATIQPHIKPPYPQLQMLTAITNEIHSAFRQAPDDPGGEDLQTSLQALANLASLIEDDQIHFGNVSSLITLLYKSPKTTQTVRVRQGDKNITVKAYNYFHRCLSRMVSTLKDRQPVFDTRSCNSLLHYTLCHRMSPKQASEQVLDHMTQRNIVSTTTTNILLHSGTKLRRNDISLVALNTLRDSSDMSHLLNVQRDKERSPLPDSKDEKASRKFTRVLKRLEREEFEAPEVLPMRHKSSEPVPADVHTLVAYIHHLTATGAPDEVAKLVFRILPELSSVEHSSWGDISITARETLMQKFREESMDRAVRLGPYFFTAVINALAKAGKTGLAERVWLLAEQAERASWILESEVEPWCLPVHAYTAMLQCYAAEAGRIRFPATITRMASQVSRQRRQPWVGGWARVIYTKNRTHQNVVSRQIAGRGMSMILFRSLLSSSQRIESYLLQNRNIDPAQIDKIKAQAPAPDARFFNAILRLFSMPFGSGGKHSRSFYDGLLRLSLARFVSKRTMVPNWSPLLYEIGRAMVAAGYPIPPAYRYLFVGRLPEATRDYPFDVDARGLPFSYPNVPARFNPRVVPTVKTNGLPVRRRRTRRWNSRRCEA